MFNFILRRAQRFSIPLKILTILAGTTTLVYLVANTSPTLGSILLFAVVLFITLSAVISFFTAASFAVLAGTTVSFLLFLKAVGLLSPLNLGLFAVFLILLGLYLHKR